MNNVLYPQYPEEGVDCVDYVLRDGVDYAWIKVDNLSVYIRRGDEGVSVDIYPYGAEMINSLGGTWVLYAEAETAKQEEAQEEAELEDMQDEARQELLSELWGCLEYEWDEEAFNKAAADKTYDEVLAAYRRVFSTAILNEDRYCVADQLFTGWLTGEGEHDAP